MNSINSCHFKHLRAAYVKLFMFKYLPLFRLHEELGHIPTWPHKKLSLLRLQSNESIFFVRIVDHRRQTIYQKSEIYIYFNVRLLEFKLFKRNITHLKFKFLNEKCTSTIPVVFTLVRSISCSVGW